MFSSAEQGRSLNTIVFSFLCQDLVWLQKTEVMECWWSSLDHGLLFLSVACLPCSTLGAFLGVVWAFLPLRNLLRKCVASPHQGSLAT